MGIINPTNKEVTQFKGLHLYHHGLSQCSQRVRICLEEKGLPWQSHVLDVMNGEHLTEYYRGINPNNLVPTLIHDGQVIIESTDIIEYIDQHFPGASFTPTDPHEREAMDMWLQTSNSTKAAIKILSHEFLFKAKAKKSPKQIAQMRASIHNQELINFSEEFSSKQGIAKEKIVQSIKEFETAFFKMNQYLAKHTWLAGEHFSLADISWMGDTHRLMLMNFPLKQYPHLQQWIKKVKARASFQKALVDYEPKVIKYFFKAYSALRHLKGSSVVHMAKAG